MITLPAQQQGVAIITALLIVAIATTLSVSFSTDLQLDVRRTGNIISSEQAVVYTQGAEDWVRGILREDRQDNNVDHLGEDWAIEIPPIPVDLDDPSKGSIQGRLTDLQSCFNLNSLYVDGAINVLARTRLETLFSNLDINVTLSQAIIDWIDDDLNTIVPDGAEDGYYLNLEKPYRVANQAIVSVSELRLVRGFEDPDNYNAAIDHVCAFGISAPININTASIEVLRSLASSLSESDAEDIVAQRESEGGEFKNINEFLNFNDLKKTITQTEGLSVSSDYFLLETQSVVGNVRVSMYSVIYRSANGDTKIIARSQGVY